MITQELTAWLQMLAVTVQEARPWQPKRLRHRLFSIAGRTARRYRRTYLRLTDTAPTWPSRDRRRDPDPAAPHLI